MATQLISVFWKQMIPLAPTSDKMYCLWSTAINSCKNLALGFYLVTLQVFARKTAVMHLLSSRVASLHPSAGTELLVEDNLKQVI